MDKNKQKSFKHERRKRRVRKKVLGTADRPRLAVFRSLRNVYVQVIDDVSGSTLVAASSQESGLKDEIKYGGNKVAAAKVGEAIARKSLAVGIRQVSFDRKGYKYHGRVKELAEAARKAGLIF
jgi:large subunit ribosomal protein L18